jgi:hypothetical protein
MTLSDFGDFEILTSFCSDPTGRPYWLFNVYEAGQDPRTYRLPQDPSDWPPASHRQWRQHPDDRAALIVAKAHQTQQAPRKLA